MAQRTRCAPRREKSRLNWFLDPSFGWNHRLNPPTTAQFIAVVSLSNSGTVPEFLKGTVPEFLQGQSPSRDNGRWAGFHPAVLGRRNADRIRARMG